MVTIIRLIAFDDPSPETHVLPFESRYLSVLSLPEDHPYVISFFPCIFLFGILVLVCVVFLFCVLTFFIFLFIFGLGLVCFVVDSGKIPAMRVHCSSRKWLAKATEVILKQGGEGLILRKVKSPYERGRSPYLLKLKVC